MKLFVVGEQLQKYVAREVLKAQAEATASVWFARRLSILCFNQKQTTLFEGELL